MIGPQLPSPAELERLTNPTGGDHTQTPWRAGHDEHGRFNIVDQHGTFIASFRRKQDRDAALFWTNAHVGVIHLMRGFQRAFDFIQIGTGDHFAKLQAEMAAIWEKFFVTQGRSALEAREDV